MKKEQVKPFDLKPKQEVAKKNVAIIDKTREARAMAGWTQGNSMKARGEMPVNVYNMGKALHGENYWVEDNYKNMKKWFKDNPQWAAGGKEYVKIHLALPEKSKQ